jgi:hypothetical protein
MFVTPNVVSMLRRPMNDAIKRLLQQHIRESAQEAREWGIETLGEA